MTLEVGTFSVHDIQFGHQTRWRDARLEVNRQELLGLVLEDPYIAWADIEIVRPGDDVRIVRMRDIIEPKIKVTGTSQTYPGIAGRAQINHRRTLEAPHHHGREAFLGKTFAEVSAPVAAKRYQGAIGG